jgi:hypothetical protein
VSRNQPRASVMRGFFGGLFDRGPARLIGKRMRPMTWSKPHQGPQEMARRVRQMERNSAAQVRRAAYWALYTGVQL